MVGYLSSYAVVGVVLLLGVLFLAVAFGANRLLRPDHPTAAKGTSYECGVDPVDPVGDGWAQLHVRYYLYAYLYLVFAVDAVFLFPWATVFAGPGYGVKTVVEMFVFVGFIVVGLAYAARKGVLTWT